MLYYASVMLKRIPYLSLPVSLSQLDQIIVARRRVYQNVDQTVAEVLACITPMIGTELSHSRDLMEFLGSPRLS